MIASSRPAKLRRSGGGIGRFIGLGHKLWWKGREWRSVVKDTLPLRIMEVEKTALEYELSLQTSQTSTSMIAREKVSRTKIKKTREHHQFILGESGIPQNYPYIWM